MSRPRKPARLWLEPERRDAKGRVTHVATWVIRDGAEKHRTGCGEADIVGAQKQLADYLARQHAEAPRATGLTARDIPVPDALTHYVKDRIDAVARPKELLRRVENLLGYWGDKTLHDISRATCKEYRQSRSTPSAARRELEDLSAACNLLIADKICREAVVVTLPDKEKGRQGFLSRDQIAALIWHCYRKREVQTVHRGPRKGEKVYTDKPLLKHIARFLVASLYTGSRSARVWQASYVHDPDLPWADLVNGVFHRLPTDETESDTKRAPPVPIPSRLLAHMRRWHAMGDTYVCQYNGRPADPKKALRKAMNEVPGIGPDFVRHHLRHTSASWLMQSGEDMNSIASYMGMTRQVLEKTYGHLHPDHGKDIGNAFSSGRAGRRAGQRAPKSAAPENPT